MSVVTKVVDKIRDYVKERVVVTPVDGHGSIMWMENQWSNYLHPREFCEMPYVMAQSRIAKGGIREVVDEAELVLAKRWIASNDKRSYVISSRPEESPAAEMETRLRMQYPRDAADLYVSSHNAAQRAMD